MTTFKDSISTDELMKTMNRLSSIIEQEKIEREKLEQNLTNSDSRFLNNHNDFFDENYIISSIKDVAKEIADLVVQRETLGKKRVVKPPLPATTKENIPTISAQVEIEDPVYPKNGDIFMNKPQSQYLFQNKGFVNRIYEKDIVSKEKIAAKKLQKYHEEMKNLQNKPSISQTSKILGGLKNNGVPIFQRYEQELEKKQKKIEEIKKSIAEKKEPTPTFQPSINKKSHTRSVSEFKAQMNSWAEKKQENIMKKQYEQLSREMSQSPFQPSINEKSRAIAEYKQENQNYSHASVRLFKEAKIKTMKMMKLYEENAPSFKPHLNERSLKMAEKKNANKSSSFIKLEKDSSFNVFQDVTPTHQNIENPSIFSKKTEKSPLKVNLTTKSSRSVTPKKNIDPKKKKFKLEYAKNLCQRNTIFTRS